MAIEFEKYKTLVEKELKKVFLALKKQTRNEKLPSVLYDAMYYSVFNGGKRIRPILCLASYASCHSTTNTQNLTTALPFACGIEFIHTFSLIQDDLPSMDNDDFRRGKPSLHCKYDEATALLTADALFALAFQIFAQTKVDEKIKNRAIIELARVCGPTGLVAGQLLDIINKNQTPNTKNQKLIDQKKTAELIAGSVKIGSIVANAKETTINKIAQAGIYIGLLFQLTDDILDKSENLKVKTQRTRAKLGAGQDQKLQIQKYFELIRKTSKELGKEFQWIIDFSDYIRTRKA